MRLVIGVYEIGRKLSPSNDYGLGRQMRRAAVSVASNIAEGHGRDHLGDYLRHLSVGKGSLAEVETQLLAVREMEPRLRRDIDTLLALCDEIGRMLSVLSRKLKARSSAKKPTTHQSPST
jgi:four helix bundle protein